MSFLLLDPSARSSAAEADADSARHRDRHDFHAVHRPRDRRNLCVRIIIDGGDRMLELVLHGVSTRKYETVLPAMADQVGVSKSEVSRETIEAGTARSAGSWPNGT